MIERSYQICMNSFSKMIDILVVVIILFMVPTFYFIQKGELLAQSLAFESTKNLINNIQTHGYLSKSMYGNYLDSLSILKKTYRICLEHTETVYEPVYQQLSGSEENFIFTGKVNSYPKITYTSEILEWIFKEQENYEVSPGDKFTITIEVQNDSGPYHGFISGEHPYYCYAAYTGTIRDRQCWEE